jgi:hypothetical protein
MVEELKIIAEMMKDVTDGAVYAVVIYMIISYLKSFTVWAVIGYVFIKSLKIVLESTAVKDHFKKGPINVIEIE